MLKTLKTYIYNWLNRLDNTEKIDYRSYSCPFTVRYEEWMPGDLAARMSLSLLSQLFNLDESYF